MSNWSSRLPKTRHGAMTGAMTVPEVCWGSSRASPARGIGARVFMSALRLPRPSRPSLPPATSSINGGGGHHPPWIQANSSKTQQNAGTANWAQLGPATANYEVVSKTKGRTQWEELLYTSLAR